MLEQNAKGYFTGNFVCSFCGLKVSQSQWFDNLAVTAGREPSTDFPARRRVRIADRASHYL